MKTKRFVTIEDGTIVDGLATTVQELLVANNLSKLFYKFYAYPDKFIKHGSVSQIEKKYGMDTLSIYNDIKKNINIV